MCLPGGEATMGPDHGVQRILAIAVGSTGLYSVAGAFWVRGARYFAEARVFIRDSQSSVQHSIETVRVEAPDFDEAMALLEDKVKEQFAPIEWARWRTAEGVGDGADDA